MSWITIAWSMAAAVCLTLMAIHLVVGIRQGSRAHLLFAVTAFSAAAMAACEYLIMRSDRVDRYIAILRWSHVPIWFLIVGLVLFVRAYLQAGRLWLAGSAIGVRTVALVLNFLLWPNLRSPLPTERRAPGFAWASSALFFSSPSSRTRLGRHGRGAIAGGR
jgi:two-component system sensor kinase FixL